MSRTPVRTPQARGVATRIRILDAAVLSLIRFGYGDTTTVRIQELAGVSRGRLQHYFPVRDDLLVAACDYVSQLRFDSLSERTDWPAEPHDRVIAAVAEMWENYNQPVFWASMELWLAARYRPELRDALRPRERELSRRNYQAIDGMFGDDLVSHRNYRSLRSLLNTSMRGFAMTRSFDQDDAGVDRRLTDWARQATVALEL